MYRKEYKSLCAMQLDIRKISGYINDLHNYVHCMVESRKEANTIDGIHSKAEAYQNTVFSVHGEDKRGG